MPEHNTPPVVTQVDRDCAMLDALDFQVGAIAKVTGAWATEWPEPVRILGIEYYRGKLNITIGQLDSSDPTDGFSINDLIPQPRHRITSTEALIAENARLRGDGALEVAWLQNWIDGMILTFLAALIWLTEDRVFAGGVVFSFAIWKFAAAVYRYRRAKAALETSHADELAKARFREAAQGMVRAIRREDEDPYPDEPYISMDDAAEVHARLVASEPAADDVINLDVEDFCGRIPENGLVSIPADLYARVAQVLTRPASPDDVDDLVFVMLNELHAHLPEIDRPMSASDLSDEQLARARNAVAALTRLSQVRKDALGEEK